MFDRRPVALTLALLVTIVAGATRAAADDLLDGIAAYKAEDWATAIAKLTPLAEAGDAEAHFYLGYMYETGKGTPADLAQAIAHYQAASEAGESKAQFNLGAAYEAGRGVERDDEAAHRWYLAAAEQGFLRAQYKVAEMFEEGRGTESDLILAYKWFKLAGRDRFQDSRKRKKKVQKRLDLYEIAEGDLQARIWVDQREGAN